MKKKPPDYNSITETPGLKASQEQIARLYNRYRFALDYTDSKDVLEVACGSGIGLGFLATRAKQIVGGDIDKKNVAIATSLYQQDSIKIKEMDAHSLPFDENSFDVVLLFEAIYYLEYPEVFVKEAYRILRKQGILIICTVNKDWEYFHPSPYTHQYFSVPQLAKLLKSSFLEVQCYGAFSTHTSGILEKIVSLIKKAAVKFHLIPESLAARAYLKRIFMGRLQPLPKRISDGMAPYEKPLPILIDKLNINYKIIYAVAVKN
ncbi:MAG: class I SAM-dependent methyltransferase [Pseudomonadota bacterium]